MPTTKTVKKTSRTMNGAKPRAAKSKGIAPRAAKLGHSTMSYAMDHSTPIATVLGAGALAAAGFFLRGQLGTLMNVAIDSLGTRLEPSKLLALAGMQRKRSFLSSMIPGFGGFAVGLVSGAAMTYFLTPAEPKSSAFEANVSGPTDGPVTLDPRPLHPSSNHVAT